MSKPLAVTAALLLLVTPTVSHAYLNPDQGSMFLQLLLGGMAGAGVLLKIYWRRLVSFLSRRPPQDP